MTTISISFVVCYTAADGKLVRSATAPSTFNIGFGKNREYFSGEVTNGTDPSKLQSVYDITLRPTAIAKDGSDHKVDLQLHLAYQGDKNFQNAPLSYFRIEPVVSGKTEEFPLNWNTPPTARPWRMSSSSAMRTAM